MPASDVFTSLGVPFTTGAAGQCVGFPTAASYIPVVRALSEEGFSMCSDLCAVDYLTYPERTLPGGVEPGRFEVVVNLLNLGAKERVRVRVQLPEADPAIASLFALYPGTEAMEREAYDMFGIDFIGHPDLTRILMPEEWEGHPLRKDFSLGNVPIQFRESGVHPGHEVHRGTDRQGRLAALEERHGTEAPPNTAARLVGMIGRRRRSKSPLHAEAPAHPEGEATSGPGDHGMTS